MVPYLSNDFAVRDMNFKNPAWRAKESGIERLACRIIYQVSYDNISHLFIPRVAHKRRLLGPIAAVRKVCRRLFHRVTDNCPYMISYSPIIECESSDDVCSWHESQSQPRPQWNNIKSLLSHQPVHYFNDGWSSRVEDREALNRSSICIHKSWFCPSCCGNLHHWNRMDAYQWT